MKNFKCIKVNVKLVCNNKIIEYDTLDNKTKKIYGTQIKRREKLILGFIPYEK